MIRASSFEDGTTVDVERRRHAVLIKDAHGDRERILCIGQLDNMWDTRHVANGMDLVRRRGRTCGVAVTAIAHLRHEHATAFGHDLGLECRQFARIDGTNR
jgi:hypothetical protein